MMANWKLGEYYLAVRCKACGIQFAFQREGETDETIHFTDRGDIVLTCPDCHFPLAYSGEHVERIKAQ
jgi:nitrate/TMAO reductase-like tetraheme cytochrome c subunit